MHDVRSLGLAFLVLSFPAAGLADLPPSPAATRVTSAYVPEEITGMTAPKSSELRELVERFDTDKDTLLGFYSVEGSDLQNRRLGEFYSAWAARLQAMPYESLGTEGRVDWLLLTRQVAYEQKLLERQVARSKEMANLVPIVEEIAKLQERRRLMQPVEAQESAETLDAMAKQVAKIQEGLEVGLKPEPPKDGKGAAPIVTTKIVAYRAIHAIDGLRAQLEDWYKFYDGYDPSFTWWTKGSHEKLNSALDDYVKFLKEKVVGIEKGKDEPIIGDPIGRAGLEAELQHEMIAYSPEELIAIANKEFAWCDAELKKASREMGFGDDWKAALEKVKQDHVAPGGQPTLVRDLELEAIKFVQDRDLVTVPPLAADMWRIRMMGPAQQKVAPFFLGGRDILVAYPTDEMDYEDKVQSMRSNNVHFARATVFHELIPGHHLQDYYENRFNTHREMFTTPFWVEGWAVWWEFQFYDLGWPKSPEDRIGALFWRSHRCARIIFSLNFQLGNWTPEQCIDFLVDRVGHERASATGEVRRSFNGDWSPLYQAGYMLGALQLRALHKELVVPGGMSNRQFHDAIMMGGPMPIEMVRTRLKALKPARDFTPDWRFAD
jgi:uncharacterized protein (DUF885 family)